MWRTLRQLLLEDRFSIVFDCGFLTPITKVTTEHIPSIIKAVSLCYVLQVICKYPAEMQELAEEATMMNWNEFLQDVSHGVTCYYNVKAVFALDVSKFVHLPALNDEYNCH